MSSYDRTPPCSLVSVTQCSQFFHEVEIRGLGPDTTYYYMIPAANGTTASSVLNFTTARAAGDNQSFTVAVLNDMGYTNAGGTYRQLNKAIDDGIAFAWHGGDISYADDWYLGIFPCVSGWPVCYNGSESKLPGGVTDEYDKPLPEGEVPNWGGPFGGDISTIYESNWDLWQQWLNNITTRIPYMVLPGNHEITCSEFDGPNNELSAYLDNNEVNSTSPKSALNYYSCPPSQRCEIISQHGILLIAIEILLLISTAFACRATNQMVLVTFGIPSTMALLTLSPSMVRRIILTVLRSPLQRTSTAAIKLFSRRMRHGLRIVDHLARSMVVSTLRSLMSSISGWPRTLLPLTGPRPHGLSQ